MPEKEKKVVSTPIVSYSDSIAKIELVAQAGQPFLAVLNGTGKVEMKKGYTGVDKIHYVPPADPTGLIPKGVIVLASKPAPYGSDEDLIESLTDFLHVHLDIPKFWEKIIAYYSMMTWVYDKFSALPYLRFIGEPESGKSTMSYVAAHICNRATFVSGASTISPIFRLIDLYRGTLCIDEADFRNSDMQADIVKILNEGYVRMGYVLRASDGAQNFAPQAFDPFGPKILNNRARFADAALETRCLTYEVPKMIKLRSDVSTQLSVNFYADAQRLRNKLLKWRFDNYDSITRSELGLEALTPRLRQITTPLWNIIKDSEFKQELMNYLLHKDVERKSNSDSAICIQAMNEIKDRYKRKSGLYRFKVADIAEQMTAIGLAEGEPKEFSGRAAGILLRNLGYKPEKKGGRGSFFTTDEASLAKLRSEYVPHLDLEDDDQ